MILFIFSLTSIFWGRNNFGAHICAVICAWGCTDTKHNQKMPIFCSWKNSRVQTKPFLDGEGQSQAGIWFLLEQITDLMSAITPKLTMQGCIFSNRTLMSWSWIRSRLFLWCFIFYFFCVLLPATMRFIKISQAWFDSSSVRTQLRLHLSWVWALNSLSFLIIFNALLNWITDCVFHFSLLAAGGGLG